MSSQTTSSKQKKYCAAGCGNQAVAGSDYCNNCKRIANNGSPAGVG